MKRSTKLIIVSGLAAAVVAGGATTIAVAQGSPAPSPDDLRAAAEAARAAVGEGDVISVERDDDRDGYDVEIRRPDGAEVDVDLSPTLVVRTQDETADGDDRDDLLPADADLGRATEVALAAAGAGTVTDVEWDDGGYDVEIRTGDGRELDVRIDASFAVASTTEDIDD